MLCVFGVTDCTDAVMAIAWTCGKQSGGQTMQWCGSRCCRNWGIPAEQSCGIWWRAHEKVTRWVCVDALLDRAEQVKQCLLLRGTIMQKVAPWLASVAPGRRSTLGTVKEQGSQRTYHPNKKVGCEDKEDLYMLTDLTAWAQWVKPCLMSR